jgi:hypothetical protein
MNMSYCGFAAAAAVAAAAHGAAGSSSSGSPLAAYQNGGAHQVGYMEGFGKHM